MSKNNNKNRIIQKGFRDSSYNQPDVVLQMPELFLFDMKDYMDSVRLAREIDYSSRVRLYDMYDSAQLDLHLSGVLAKRLRGVTRFPIEFQRNGIPDEKINIQLQSPWFKKLRKDIILAEFWGFSLMQFYLDEKGNICYDLIDRKHYDPIRRKLLKYQGDQDGVDIDSFDNMLFVGEQRELGIFSELLPAVLYKRGDMSDWAMFCNIFGMPIREYTYDAGDEEARIELLKSAKVQGRNAVYIHPDGSTLKLIESGNKTGSSELYKSFAEYWDGKISIRVLGNTLTTDSKDKGTQALGTVHKEEEDNMNEDDRETILDVLNYDMADIFQNLGFNVAGGEFVYAKKEKMDPSVQLSVVQGLRNMGLPLDDDWLYETFAVKKPDDYQQQKTDAQARKDALQKQLAGNNDNTNNPNNPDDKANLNGDKKAFKNILKGFFGIAPQDGAVTE
jgi:phage gp29-like protein